MKFCFAFLLCSFAYASDKNELAKLDEILNGDYDKYVNPLPVNVTISVHIRNARWANEILTVTLFLRQSWEDVRLKNDQAFTFMTFGCPSTYIDRVWTPDTYISNAETVLRNLGECGLRIDRTGSLLKSEKMVATLPCFPKRPDTIEELGTIDCDIIFSSYFNSDESVKLKLREDVTSAFTMSSTSPNLVSVKQFQHSAKTNTGEYTKVGANIRLRKTLNNQQCIVY